MGTFLSKNRAKPRHIPVYRVRAVDWLLADPLPIPEICGIIGGYCDQLEGACVRALVGHTRRIRALISLPDGKLATCSDDKTIRICDPSTGALKVLTHKDGVTALAVRPGADETSAQLVSGSYDGTVRLWDPSTGALLRTVVRDAGHITALVARPNGDIISGNTLGTMWLISPDPSAPISSLTGYTPITSMALMPDNMLASSAGKNISVWYLDPRECVVVCVLKGHADIVTSLAALPDGKLASGSLDCTVSIWEVDISRPLGYGAGDGICLRTITYRDQILSLAAFPDGRLATGSSDGIIRVCDPESKGILSSMEIPSYYAPRLAVVLKTGQLASVHDDKEMRVWGEFG